MICAFSHIAKAQTIIIDSTFTNDAIIQPFGPNDTLYSLKISGSLTLNSDTSLVRVVVGNEDSLEYMVYESYPLISSEYSYSFLDQSDETSYLNTFLPKYLKVYLINASLSIDSLCDWGNYQENLDSLQAAAKHGLDLQKILAMNQILTNKGLNWVAGETQLVNYFFKDKKYRFGYEKYNLQGFEYYISGVFSFPSDNYLSGNNSIYVDEFNWRYRHNANLSTSFYYNGTSGWLTELRDQGDCWACSVFGTLASAEAVSNLYFNQPVNFDLSEQQVYYCLDARCIPTPSTGGYVYPIDALNYIRDNETFDENCYMYDPLNQNCYDYCFDDPAEYAITTNGRLELNSYYHDEVDSLKSRIIQKGPMVIWIKIPYVMSHVMSLIGFYTESGTNEITWIFKDSEGGGQYREMKLDPDEICEAYNVKTPITAEDLQPPYINYNVEAYDNDEDGYFNWGIGSKPDNLDECYSDLPEDSDDDNKYIGPFDENYYGTNIGPEIAVYSDNGVSQTYIENEGFVYFNFPNFTHHFYIENPGSAILHLNPLTPISICNQCNYNLDISTLNLGVCMNNGTSNFDIGFNSTGTGIEITPVYIDIIDNDFIEDFEFALVYFDCQKIPGELEIDADDTWDGYMVINQDVKILEHVTLEITGNVAFAHGVKVIVEGGAELIINGGTLTGACGEFWDGIDIWGNDEHSQYSGRQGKVTIKNGGTIKHAICGIETGEKALEGGYYIPSGGIVQSNGGVFEDNIKGVRFHPYHNFNPQTGDPANNLSKFKDTEFIISQEIYDMGEEPDAGVDLNWVEGILFKGNTFENIANTTNGEYRGIGIKSATAGFYVQNLCISQTTPCSEYIISKFKHLDYGIKVLGERESLPILIDSAIFIDNLRGIFMSGVNGADMFKNSFSLNISNSYHESDDTLVGVYLEACQNFLLTENHFNGFMGTQTRHAGIYVLNLGPYYNEIYNNSITNLNTGIGAAGENRNGTEVGLCLKCNDFTDCETDIFVTPNGGVTTEYLGIALQQGNFNHHAFDPAGNTFTNEYYTGLIYHYNNETVPTISYIHHIDNNPYVNIRPDEIVNVNPLVDPEAPPYSKEQSCPSSLGGGIDIPAEMNTLSIEAAQITAYEDTLNQLVDGGDTDDLSLEVQTSFPDEAMQVRQELLNESPYLSDTVMETAIYKENVLPNVMIRDVLVANPQSAKSAKVLNAIDDRFDPMPDYMMAEIMQGQNTLGAKELLEQGLALHATSRTRSLNKLIRHYKQDTINSWAQDSLLALLNIELYPGPRYQAAFIYLDNGDSVTMQNILNVIPTELVLTDIEISIHNLYSDLFDILLELQADSVTAIDSIQEAALLDIAQYNHLLPGVYARNILLKHGLITYVEPVYLPDNLKSTPTWQNAKPNKRTNKKFLKVYPNPAGHYFIVEYDLRGTEGSTVMLLSDLSGSLVSSIILNDKQNQQLVSTDPFSPGMYILQLFINNELIETHKIQIVK